MNKLLSLLNWVIRLKQKGEMHDVSKSAEKFKWFSVILEFIQNAIDSSIRRNKELKLKNSNHKDFPTKIKISFTKMKFADFSKNFLTEKFKKVLGLSRHNPNAVNELTGNENCDLLILEDFNTQGILGDHKRYSPTLENGEDNPIFRFNFYVGDDEKLDDPDLGGSEGEGRQTFYYASKISTFFYYTKRENKIPLIYGMTFIGNAKESNGQSWMPVLRYGKEIPMTGKLGEDQIETDLSYAIPYEDDECNKLFKSVVPIKRKEENGTSIVIPFYDRRYLKKDRVISKIIEIYRVQILRGQLIIEIDDEVIDDSTIDELTSKYSNYDEYRLPNALKYFDFIRSIKQEKNISKFEINLSQGINLAEDNVISNFDEFIEQFNKKSVIKLRCNFSLNKKVKGRVGEREKNIKTFFDLYLKQADDQIRSFSLNDFVRGSLPIYDEKKKIDAFTLLDVQDSEAKLFFKCAEGANHSIWDPFLWKLDQKKYYTETYSWAVRLAKKIPENILRLIEAKDTRPDYDTFSDLFPDLSDDGRKKQKKKKKKTKAKVKITSPFVPHIFGKLKNYEINESQDKAGGFNIKGNSFNKKDISSKISTMKDEKKKLIEFIKKEEDEEKKDLMSDDLVKIERRIKEYEEFLDNGCDNYPINIRLKMAFEGEHLSNPFRKYDPKKHFDLEENKEFKFKTDGDVSIKKCNQNMIVLSASSSNFKFSLTGFAKISNYDVAVKDVEEVS